MGLALLSTVRGMFLLFRYCKLNGVSDLVCHSLLINIKLTQIMIREMIRNKLGNGQP